MQYSLKFIDSFEQTVRALKVEADDDDTATDYTCKQSIHFDADVELWRGDIFLARMTPMTARLYLPDLVGRKVEA